MDHLKYAGSFFSRKVQQVRCIFDTMPSDNQERFELKFRSGTLQVKKEIRICNCGSQYLDYIKRYINQTTRALCVLYSKFPFRLNK